jgi:exopolyphosphatase/guanosine-5'-triphosphate,3'-diphosphate pyrophosphatase
MSPPAVARLGPSALPRLELLPSSTEPARSAAVIDLGSNSWRCDAYRYVPDGPWRLIGKLQEPVRVAKGLAASGRLDPLRTARGLDALEAFAHYARALGVPQDDIVVVATSALREADDGSQVIQRAAALTGLEIRTLSAHEEARYGYVAAVNSTTLTDGLTLDLGGGSLQLVRVRDRAIDDMASWPLGAVRVSEELLAGDRATSRKQLKRARAAIRRRLGDFERLSPAEPRIFGMGGAVRNLATAALRAWHPAVPGVQGYWLRAQELSELVDMLARRPVARRALPGIKSARADIVLGAALVLEAVLDLTGSEGLGVTRAGLREGVFFVTRLRTDTSPLVGDVRVAAVRNLAAQQGVDLGRAEHVTHLALGLQHSVSEATGIPVAADEPELLWAAAMLHEVGTSIDYDGQPSHARYVLLNSGLYGHGPRELAVIAQIVRYQRKGTPSLDDLAALAGAGDRELVARCALMLRLALQLVPGPDRGVRDAQLVRDGDDLHLELRGDERFARWAVTRQADDDAFSATFGRRLRAAD